MLIYNANYKDINENQIRIEIYDKSETAVTPKELLLSSDPITINYESDDLFKSLKQSGCTVNVLTKDILQNLYTGKINDITVKIYKNDSLFWFGYLTPNIYSSEFNDDYDLLSLEFIDTIAQLENLKYDKTDNGIISFYSLISNILDKIDIEKNINEIYLHNSYKINDFDDLLNNLYIQERNFFDEDNQPENSNEVMNDLISYLGMSMIQFNDRFYIIDYTALKNGNYDFIAYNRNDNSVEKLNLNTDIRSITEIGIAESNASISLGDVYNKVSVIANNNPVDTLLPDLYDNLINQNSDPNKYYEKTIDTKTHLTAYFNSDEWVTSGTYNSLESNKKDEVTLDLLISGMTTAMNGGITSGTVFQKNDSYTTDDGKPSSLNWTDYLTMIQTIGFLFIPDQKPNLRISKPNIIFKGGNFIIDINYLLSQSPIPTDNFTSSDAVFYDGKYSSGIYDTKFKCKLQIGDYYYNGNSWNKESCFFWLARKNNAGDKIFCTEYKLTNQVSYEDNLIDAGDGVLITLPDFVLSGTLNFELFAPDRLGQAFNYRTDKPQDYTIAKYCHIKELKMIYTNSKYYVDIFNDKEYDPDILYSNVVNEDFVTELDDITLKVNTYNKNSGSYSYVITKDDNELYDYVETVKNKRTAENKKMEEFIIEKYITHYNNPKFCYSNTINNKNITPISIIKENTINKSMLLDSAIYDLLNNAVTVNLKEL